MDTIKAAAAALAVAVLSAAGVRAADGPAMPAAGFHAAPAGSVFHYRRDRAAHDVQIGKTDGHFVDYTADGKTRTLYMLTGVQPEYLTADELASLDAIWPLAVGKAVTFHRQMPGGRSGSWSDELKVIGTEKIAVGAESFDTFIVRWTSSGEYRTRWDATGTYWYAPALGWSAKAAYSDSGGIRWEETLVSYELAR